MKVTHKVLAGGHFVTGETSERMLTIVTEHGKPEELRAFADQEADRVAKVIRRIEFARQMAQQMEQGQQ